MKKVVYILTASILFFACKKTDLANPESQNLSRVESLLKDSLSVQDYNRVDFTSVQQTQLKDHSTLFRFNFKALDSASEFIVLPVMSARRFHRMVSWSRRRSALASPRRRSSLTA